MIFKQPIHPFLVKINIISSKMLYLLHDSKSQMTFTIMNNVAI